VTGINGGGALHDIARAHGRAGELFESDLVGKARKEGEELAAVVAEVNLGAQNAAKSQQADPLASFLCLDELGPLDAASVAFMMNGDAGRAGQKKAASEARRIAATIEKATSATPAPSRGPRRI
jgi:hypothetical protein